MKILITGTSQGIGLQAYNMLSRNHDVYTINRAGFNSIHNYICDLSNISAVEMLAKEIKSEHWDVLINNAGGATPFLFEDMSISDLTSCTNLNYFTPVILMQAVLGGMKERGFGRIINISSIASKSPRKFIPHYGAAKSALESFSKSMAVYYSNCGITINCVCPGGIDTITSRKNREKISDLLGEKKAFYSEQFTKNNGIGSLLPPDIVVNMLAFLLAPEASCISGQSINICGTMETH